MPRDVDVEGDAPCDTDSLPPSRSPSRPSPPRRRLLGQTAPPTLERVSPTGAQRGTRATVDDPGVEHRRRDPDHLQRTGTLRDDLRDQGTADREAGDGERRRPHRRADRRQGQEVRAHRGRDDRGGRAAWRSRLPAAYAARRLQPAAVCRQRAARGGRPGAERTRRPADREAAGRHQRRAGEVRRRRCLPVSGARRRRAGLSTGRAPARLPSRQRPPAARRARHGGRREQRRRFEPRFDPHVALRRRRHLHAHGRGRRARRRQGGLCLLALRGRGAAADGALFARRASRRRDDPQARRAGALSRGRSRRSRTTTLAVAQTLPIPSTVRGRAWTAGSARARRPIRTCSASPRARGSRSSSTSPPSSSARRSIRSSRCSTRMAAPCRGP